MDLGIAGKWALVCGASRGLGHGCAAALAGEGVNLVVVARDAAALEMAAQALRERGRSGIEVRAVATDITQAEGRAAALAASPRVDILVTNAGGPPTGDFRDWDREQWLRALDANMLTPIELMKATVDAMAQRGFGRIINITSAAVKAPIDTLGLSNGARSGLTGFVAGLARQRQLASRNVTINNMLPGPFDTERLRNTLAADAAALGIGADDFIQRRRGGVPAGRFGRPEEFGALCAFLCSAQAAFITGQNLLLDGGAYPGTF